MTGKTNIKNIQIILIMEPAYTPQGTLLAQRILSAKALAQLHQQGVEFIIDFSRPGKVVFKESFDLVMFCEFKQPQPVADPFGIGIHHKGGFAGRIKDDRIRSFGTDAMDGQKFFP
jgi:hypothetical protein